MFRSALYRRCSISSSLARSRRFLDLFSVERKKALPLVGMHQKSDFSNYASNSKVDITYINRLKHLEKTGEGVYRATFFGERPPHSSVKDRVSENIYGGLLFSQAMLAAEKTVNQKFEPHSIHAFFTLNGSYEKPIDYKVENVRDGRSFTNRSVKAIQEGNVVLSAQISLCTKEPSAIEHQQEMPKVPPPEEVRPFFDEARTFLKENETGQRRLADFQIKALKRRIEEDEPYCVFEFRPVEPSKFMALEKFRPQSLYYWMRTVVPIPTDDPQFHRFLVTYITDATLVSAANSPHFSHSYKPSMLFTLDHTVHFHDHEYRADEWLFYENLSRIAKNGRALTEGRIWTRDGRLVISTSQESLSRTKTEPSKL